MKIIKVIALLCFISNNVFAQPFVFISTKTEGLIQSNSYWIDVNKDGFDDLITTGERFSANYRIVETNLYLNDRRGNFNASSSGIMNLYRSAMDWQDIDKDGDQDLFITGENSKNEIVSRIYKNNGHGKFSGIVPQIQAVRDGAVDLGDFDKDGTVDIVICGENNGQIYSKVYKNVGNFNYQDLNANLMPLFGGSVKWGDFDNDNDEDILICGETKEGIPYTLIYRNEGNNKFVNINASLVGVKSGKAIWGDFDGDNDLDIFLTGETHNNQLTSRFYRNDRRDGFTEIGTPLLGMRSGNVQIKDYDCDDDLDLLVSGESVFGPTTRVYRNDGNFVFTDANARLPGVYMGGAYWADYDNDCDAEIFIIGLDDCYDFEAKLYRNDGDIKIKEVKTELTNSLWINTKFSFLKKSPYYYFVWSSCYCNPQNLNFNMPGQVSNNDYNAYISDIHYIVEPYALQKVFNKKITVMVHDWAEVMGGHRVSIGYVTKQEAINARKQIIRDYQSESFKINVVVL